MFKKLFFSIVFLYFLILLQESFFVHFFYFLPNLTLTLVLLINLFEDRESDFGIFLAIIGGFLIDVFSVCFFGLYTITLLLISFFIKIVFRNYFQFNLR